MSNDETNQNNDVLGLMDIFKQVSAVPSPLAQPTDQPTIPKKSVNEGSPKNPDYNYLWDNCELDDTVNDAVSAACEKILAHKDRYQNVEDQLGIKWYFIAAIHYRETSLSFKAAFHNGDPIIGTGKTTTHVPAGRGPFDTWEESVIDACKLLKLDQITNWDIYACLAIAERYNGFGYRKQHNENGDGEYTPYVWAGTNNSDETGKYAADGKFDPLAVEKQMGVAAIFKGLGL